MARTKTISTAEARKLLAEKGVAVGARGALSADAKAELAKLGFSVPAPQSASA